MKTKIPDAVFASYCACAIRMASGTGALLPVVRFRPTTGKKPIKGPKALSISQTPDSEKQCALIQQSIASFRKKTGDIPALVEVTGLGVFTLQPAEMDTGKRLLGKIAVVTGSAQGFGQGIARLMAHDGAHVVVADIQESRARETAEKLCAEYGPWAARAISVDVTSEESIRQLCVETVLSFGGLDVLVSNAGILRAGGLDEMDLGTFELVTRINYSAYFLCVKHASAYMKLQHRFNPSLFMDIIQINSKSGLSGSNKNFAYAGGKFGGIGLTQSFALELIEHNIKVNAICPGNFFEGPLWSDPKNGLFVQYLKAGKVPGAKTVADVKRFYENKVPMGRGCTPEDVTRAIVYVIEQTYETGQAVPVTGGQEMK